VSELTKTTHLQYVHYQVQSFDFYFKASTRGPSSNYSHRLQAQHSEGSNYKHATTIYRKENTRGNANFISEPTYPARKMAENGSSQKETTAWASMTLERRCWPQKSITICKRRRDPQRCNRSALEWLRSIVIDSLFLRPRPFGQVYFYINNHGTLTA